MATGPMCIASNWLLCRRPDPCTLGEKVMTPHPEIFRFVCQCETHENQILLQGLRLRQMSTKRLTSGQCCVPWLSVVYKSIAFPTQILVAKATRRLRNHIVNRNRNNQCKQKKGKLRKLHATGKISSPPSPM